MIIPMRFENGKLVLLDQLRLPLEEVWIEICTWQETARAISEMIVRGAPAIGVCAAYGFALGYSQGDLCEEGLCEMSLGLSQARPTAVNLAWAVHRMQNRVRELQAMGKTQIFFDLCEEAKRIHEEDISLNRRIAENSLPLFFEGIKILTHCNAGSLATGGYGTALGCIYAAHERKMIKKVWVDETRPFLQGARLTAYELHKAKVEHTLICDNMAGSLMKKGEVDAVIVGADRITANGDVANKIGTYPLAVLCHYHQIPFYVAAPSSTFDLRMQSGDEIPIEQRKASELSMIHGRAITATADLVYNPGFDVTPNTLITAIVTEKGLLRPPYVSSLKTWLL